MDKVCGDELVFEPRPVHDYFFDSCSRYAERPVADFLGKVWTYRDYAEQVDQLVPGLQKLGVVPGVRVGLCLPNTPYYTVFYFAILKAGGTVVNFNPLYALSELENQIGDSGVRIMVTMDLKLIYDKIERLRASGALDTVVVCPMKSILPTIKSLLFRFLKAKEVAEIPADAAHPLFSDLLGNAADAKPVDVDPHETIAVLQYTGGTTGTPKGAMLTHANLSANIQQMGCIFQHADFGAERMLCVLPFFHVFAMTAGQNLSILLGAQMILLPKFELKPLLKSIERTKATLLPGVPTLFTAINKSPLAKKTDLSSLTLCLSGGAPLPVEVKTDFEALTGCILSEGYGLTEASPVCVVNPLDQQSVAGSIGIRLPGMETEFRDLEDRTKCVPKGDKGELCVRGPQVMRGYWNRPEDTAEVIDERGFLHTGDVGYEGEGGFIYLVDRIKDLILCSGYNVYPRVIEEAIYKHESVMECTVIGVPDGYRGQVPKAFVRLKEDKSLTAAELKVFLRDHLSQIESPRSIEFRDQLPKTIVGKLSKKELIAEEAAARGGGSSEPCVP
ncbi:MAG: long-chain fatty acid--CoA ligase [Rhodobacteraceae bacterium]|nr:long-chain fatty acid--CoA ligase [Paracoccaceae bacterium]